jgi:hypothetical protein
MMNKNRHRVGYVISTFCITLSAYAGTVPVASVIYSPDITLDLGGQVTSDENAALDDLSGSVTLQNIGVIPPNADLSAYHRFDNGDQLLSFDITITLPGPVIARPGDVVRRAANGSFSIEFNGAAEGVPAGARIDAVSVEGNGDLLLSFDTTVGLPSLVAADEDVVGFDGSDFSLVFDGSAAGLTPGADLDALHYASDSGLIYASFDIGGTVGGINFSDEDLLRYDPGTTSWTLAYDGSAEHLAWNAGDLDAVFVTFLPEIFFKDGFESP